MADEIEPMGWHAEWTAPGDTKWVRLFVNELDAIEWAMVRTNVVVTPLFPRPVSASPEPVAEPMFYVRLCGDGLYEGPIHRAQLEARSYPGIVWSPLHLGSPPTKVEPLTDEQITDLTSATRDTFTGPAMLYDYSRKLIRAADALRGIGVEPGEEKS